MNTFDRLWTALAILLTALPFVAVGFELAKSESLLTIAVFVAMAVLLFGTLIIGMRVKAEPSGEPRSANEETSTVRSSR
jgi:undecaprenyl pyrophosphate phosphatase UppP